MRRSAVLVIAVFLVLVSAGGFPPQPGQAATVGEAEGTPVARGPKIRERFLGPDAVRRTPAWVETKVNDRYIVILRDDVPDPGSFADKLALTDGLIVTHV